MVETTKLGEADMHLMHNFYIFVTALFMSLIMVPAIRKWAFDSGAVDFPGERRVHNRAVARAGGVAIFIPFLFSILVYSEMNREVRGILAGSLIIFFTGLIDDLYQLSAKRKFIGQFSGCLVAILVGHLYLMDLGNLFGLGDIFLGDWWGIVLSLFALVGVVNALNLIDGLDGLAAGVSAISLLAFCWLGLQENNLTVLALSAGMLGALLGFLKYNSFPAQIFMGDNGSLVVGFVLGCLAIAMTQNEGSAVSAVVPLMILSVPITDTLVVMFGRGLRGQNPFKPDRTHLHHKIMALGFEHSLTVLLICSLSLIWALLALAFRSSPDIYLFGVLVVGTVAQHLGLNSLVKRKGRLHELWVNIRGHVQASRIQAGVAKLSGVVDALIFSSLLVYALSSWTLQLTGLNFWLVVTGFVSGLSGLFMLLSGRVPHSVIYLLLLWPVLLINFQFEVEGSQEWWWLTLGQVTNVLFVVLAILLAYKFIVLKSLDHVLDFSLEFLLFAMGLTLAVVSPDVDLAFHLSGVVSRGIIIFLALRFITIGSYGRILLSAVVIDLSLLIMAI